MRSRRRAPTWRRSRPPPPKPRPPCPLRRPRAQPRGRRRRPQRPPPRPRMKRQRALVHPTVRCFAMRSMRCSTYQGRDAPRCLSRAMGCGPLCSYGTICSSTPRATRSYCRCWTWRAPCWSTCAPIRPTEPPCTARSYSSRRRSAPASRCAPFGPRHLPRSSRAPKMPSTTSTVARLTWQSWQAPPPRATGTPLPLPLPAQPRKRRRPSRRWKSRPRWRTCIRPRSASMSTGSRTSSMNSRRRRHSRRQKRRGASERRWSRTPQAPSLWPRPHSS